MDVRDDVSLVEALRAGRSGALGGLYDRYADRLFTYAVTLVGDRDRAGDVVHDAMLLAHERVHQLRDPERLRPWLYAIVRSEALRTLRAARRDTTLDTAGDVSDPTVDLDAGLSSEEARSLVRAALGGLGDTDREVVELALRHDLDNSEVASTLGVSSSHASALMSRAKTRLERSLTTVLLMRGSRSDCARLKELVGDTAVVTPLLRKRVSRHVEDCDVCAERRRTAVLALPSVAVAAPMLTAPASLRTRLVSAAGDLADPSAAREVGDRTPRFDGDGFARAPRTGRHGVVTAAATVTVALMLGIAGTVALTAERAEEDRTPAAAGAPVSAPSRPTSTSAMTPERSSSDRSPDAGRMRRPVPTARGTTPSAAPRLSPRSPRPRSTPTRRPRSDVPRPTTSPARPPSALGGAVRLRVSWTDLDSAACDLTFRAQVVTSTNRPEDVVLVVAAWAAVPPDAGSGGARLVPADGVWTGVLQVPTQQQNRLVVRAVLRDGRTVSAQPQDLSHVCPG